MQGGGDIEEYAQEEDFKPKRNSGLKSKFEVFLDSRYFIALALILVASTSYFLGRISKIEEDRTPIKVVSGSEGEVKGATNLPNPLYIKEGTKPTTSVPAVTSDTQVVASKNGTKYHLPTCAGAKQISEKNKITFNSIEEARAAGYTPAANCKGLK